MAEETLSGGMKLTLIQNQIKVPKTERNEFGGFNYRTTDEIQYFLKPLCAKYHTQVVPTTESVVMGWADTIVGVYQKATVSMLDADTGELIAESTAMAREDDDRKKMSAPQVSASAAQFAVKRALEQLLMLDGSAPEVDALPQQAASQPVPQPRQAVPQQPRAQARTQARPAQPVQAPRQAKPAQASRPVQAPQKAPQRPVQPQQAQAQQSTVKAPQKPSASAPQAPAGPRAGWAQQLKEYDAQQKAAQADPWAATMKDNK